MIDNPIHQQAAGEFKPKPQPPMVPIPKALPRSERKTLKDKNKELLDQFGKSHLTPVKSPIEHRKLSVFTRKRFSEPESVKDQNNPIQE